MTDAALARLQARLAAIPKAAREAIGKALDTSADEVVSAARALAPVESGDLRDSIRKEGGDHDLQRRVVAGSDEVFYARLVEFGTVQAPARPFFWPAYRLVKKRVRARISRAVGKAARDAAKGAR